VLHEVIRDHVDDFLRAAPYRLRYLLAWDHGLSRAVLAVHARALRDFYRQQAQRQGTPAGRPARTEQHTQAGR